MTVVGWVRGVYGERVEEGEVRGYYHSCSGLGDGTHAGDGGRDLVEPALELAGEGGAVVGVPGAGVSGFSGGHCREGGCLKDGVAVG